MASEEEVKEIKRRHAARLLREPGVCGVGVEKDKAGNFVLAVHVDGTRLDAGATVPDFIEGCPVKRIRSGPFTRRDQPAAERIL
jgi:hypothetical protein